MAGLGTIELKSVSYLRAHIGWSLFILIAGLGTWLALSSWLAEHDRRVIAEEKVELSQERVNSMEQVMEDRDKQTAETISALKARAARIETPEQAIIAMPEVSSLPIRSVPGTNLVEAPAVQLYQELAQCKQDQRALETCEADKIDLNKIGKEKDGQIADLKKKPGFWKALKSGAKKVGVGIIVGLVLREAV